MPLAPAYLYYRKKPLTGDIEGPIVSVDTKETQVTDLENKLIVVVKIMTKELNEIRARDGVPYNSWGNKASVSEYYFDKVVRSGFSVLREAQGDVDLYVDGDGWETFEKLVAKEPR